MDEVKMESIHLNGLDFDFTLNSFQKWITIFEKKIVGSWKFSAIYLEIPRLHDAHNCGQYRPWNDVKMCKYLILFKYKYCLVFVVYRLLSPTDAEYNFKSEVFSVGIFTNRDVPLSGPQPDEWVVKNSVHICALYFKMHIWIKKKLLAKNSRSTWRRCRCKSSVHTRCPSTDRPCECSGSRSIITVIYRRVTRLKQTTRIRCNAVNY